MKDGSVRVHTARGSYGTRRPKLGTGLEESSMKEVSYIFHIYTRDDAAPPPHNKKIDVRSSVLKKSFAAVSERE